MPEVLEQSSISPSRRRDHRQLAGDDLRRDVLQALEIAATPREEHLANG